MFAVIRRYNVQADAAETIRQRVEESFLPTISKLPGFAAYYVVNGGDGTLASVSVFDDRSSAEASNRLASEWVREHIATLIKTSPVILTGDVIVHHEPAATR